MRWLLNFGDCCCVKLDVLFGAHGVVGKGSKCLILSIGYGYGCQIDTRLWTIGTFRHIYLTCIPEVSFCLARIKSLDRGMSALVIQPLVS